MKLNPQQRHHVLLFLTARQEPGVWQQKAVATEPDGRVLIVERARLELGVSSFDIGRTIDLATGEIDTAVIKPSVLPDAKEHWQEFRLST